MKDSNVALLILAVILGSLVLYIALDYFSIESRFERQEKDLFESCMERIARDYCEEINLEYFHTLFDWGNMEIFPDNLKHLDYPTQFTCKDKRKYNEIDRFKFTNEEIGSCIDLVDLFVSDLNDGGKGK